MQRRRTLSPSSLPVVDEGDRGGGEIPERTRGTAEEHVRLAAGGSGGGGNADGGLSFPTVPSHELLEQEGIRLAADVRYS